MVLSMEPSDSTAQSDGGGAVSGDLVTCTPYGYRVSTDAALDETKVTMEVPQLTSLEILLIRSSILYLVPLMQSFLHYLV